MKFIALKICDGGAKGRISFCCKALKVTRQGFHEYLKNRNKPWKHEELAAKMMEIVHEDECNDTYGRERMHKALLLKYPDSEMPSETTVYRVMTAIGITHRPNRKPNGITKADREARKSDDLLKRDFKADKPFSKCVTDITEVKAKNGKLYVSAIFDCYDLTAVGLSMDDNMRAELCAVTVENTAAAYPEFCGAVLHSDRGSQYTSASYRSALNEYGVKQSMNSAGGRCHDNARCESMWARMKSELFYSRGRKSTDYTTEQLKTMIWRYYMSYWNNRRICSSIGGMPPAEKRRRYYSDKTGKSAVAAAVALLLTCSDGEERAEVYGCAADRQQAVIVFDVAADMVRMCPALSKRVKILASQKRLIYTPKNSFYQVLSAEAYIKHGFNIHGVVFDELHTQPNRKLFDVMTQGSGDARMQPLYFLITTAGTDTHSICYETHQKAKDIIEGRKIDPTFYPVIYGADESDDWTDPKVWKKANSSLDITVGIDKVKAACDSAKQNPGEENAFRQLRLNQWVKQAVRWMPMEKWDNCAFSVDEDELEGRVCYGGLDLSSTTDITTFVLVYQG